MLCAACYRPADERACQVSCVYGDPDRAVCPGSLTCGEDNLCFEGTQCGDSPDAGGIDAETDADILPVCLQTAVSNMVCPLAFHPGTFTLRTDLDTNNDTHCDEVLPLKGLFVCMIAADNIRIDGVVAARGSRPLLLIARDTITVSGTLDLSKGGAGAGGACAPVIDGVNGATARSASATA